MTAIWQLSRQFGGLRRSTTPCLRAMLGDRVSKMSDAVYVQGWSHLTLAIARGSEVTWRDVSPEEGNR